MKKIIIALLLLSSIGVAAQKERGLARKGNRYYADSAYVEAEVAYLKALDKNPDMYEAKFNLAASDMRQQKFDDAIDKYEVLAATSEDKVATAEIYHNMGNAYMSNYNASLQDQEKSKTAGEVLDKAIETYKKSLRNNPADDAARYNLAVAQKLKKEGPPEQDQQDQQDQQDKQDQEDQQDKKDQEEQEQEQNQDQENQDQQNQDQQQEQKEQQAQPNEISKEDAEKILNAMMQEEKELQEEQKEKQKAAMRGKRVEKDW